ncbi:MAG: hypothetical protein OdinLCB4_001315 [Candidatus Odinarchaeum yellowstonii]|uniref:Uncharacterized protein n=1 Tax=Odinarchaeota yellowstonii (strain LCB_4) TaxID=1841599 RepID=A0AAF0IBP1_ODILC|nr:MAG: hypothetical protein OdinLCB4_001315 [Candidatus Odinarchaeum yellowstonii]
MEKNKIVSNPAFKIVLTALNMGLYAVVGLLTYFGITVGGIKFWPAVIVPATFSVLFGPFIGGVGAAGGIFIADLLTHGDALLSLSVGCTSNFTAFFILGWLTYNKYTVKRYLLSATGSLLIGSGIIGLGLFLWTQLFTLPGQPFAPWTWVAALTYFGWTFLSEIPFLLIIVPPIIKAVKHALPGVFTSES